jgi:hypothetical protein
VVAYLHPEVAAHTLGFGQDNVQELGHPLVLLDVNTFQPQARQPWGLSAPEGQGPVGRNEDQALGLGVSPDLRILGALAKEVPRDSGRSSPRAATCALAARSFSS